MSARFALFIDAAYVYREFARRYGRVDYPSLRTALAQRLAATPVASHFFNAVDEKETAATHAFHEALKKWHFTVHLGWLQSRGLVWADGSPVTHPLTGERYVLQTQKGVDVALAHHLTKSHSMEKWEYLALVAGDADFEEPVAELVKEQGVRLYLVGIEGTLSTRLQALATEILFLNSEPLRSEASGVFGRSSTQPRVA
jgi:uncharacterized LabA/DUF88 family protein